MVTPEAGKSPDNWSAVLGAVATLPRSSGCVVLPQGAGQTPRPPTETQRYDAEMLRGSASNHFREATWKILRHLRFAKPVVPK